MADSDLIACLYPFYGDSGSGGEAAKTAIEMYENESRYVPKKYAEPKVQYGRRDRAPTEEPEEPGASHLDYLPRMEIRFSQPPKTPNGLVFGSDVNSDIVLPWMQGISFHHFALTFDKRNRLIVKDLDSFCGTQVTYDKEGKGKRSDFVWIIGGHEILERDREKIIVIRVHARLKFQIVVPHHDRTSQQYVDNVNLFRQGVADMDNLVGLLDLGSRAPTQRATGAQTPGMGKIHLRKVLGEGGFGVVSHMWDVSTGEEFALKEPSSKATKANKVDFNAWRMEARIMGRISHENIVTFFGCSFTPWPQLKFEYMPGGALAWHNNISEVEGAQILCQCLSALTYLHGQQPPIIHRDIKPENILVKYRHAGHIDVKFGDFGLSRDAADPKTICGTWVYLAPEIYSERLRRNAKQAAQSYSAAIDIWALGMTIVASVYGFAPGQLEIQNTGVYWCWAIINRIKRNLEWRPNELEQFLCDHMLIIEPELRSSAEACYAQVPLLVYEDGADSKTPTTASFPPVAKTPTAASFQHRQAGQSHATDQYGADQQTARLQEADPNDSTDSRQWMRTVVPSPNSRMPGNADNPEPWSTDLRANPDVRPKQSRKRSAASSSGMTSRKRWLQEEQYSSTLPWESEPDGPGQEDVEPDVPVSTIEGDDGQGLDASAEAASVLRKASWVRKQMQGYDFTASEDDLGRDLLIELANDIQF